MMKLLVLDEAANEYRDLLNQVTEHTDFAFDPERARGEYDALLAQPDLAAQYLRKGGKTKWIQSTWAGVRPLFNIVDQQQTTVTGIKEVFGTQIAEYVFAYVLEALRDLTGYRATQTQRRWQPDTHLTLSGRQMTIVGTGSIGSHLARVAKNFGMQVTGVSRSGNPLPSFDTVLPGTQLNTAVQQADYVILILPDTTAATDLFDVSVFNAMQAQPLLINVGRGSSINDEALIQALRNGQLRGAVLDVFKTEPLPNDHAFWDEPGVTITPHIAAISYPRDIAQVFLSNLQKFRAGEPLDFQIDLSRGY